MALLFCDSFDHYDTAHIQEKYSTIGGNGASISNGSGRNGTAAMLLTNNAPLLRPIPNSSTVIVGFALNDVGTIPGQYLMSLASGAYDPEFYVALDGAGTLTAYPATQPAIGSTASGIVPKGVYVYLEIKVVCSAQATGSVVIRANGIVVFSAINVQTMRSTNYASSVKIYGQNVDYFDDYYICDATGTTNADFLGDVKVASRTGMAA
ncbi:MAG: hypothetical protein NVSMB64_29330 [Candidatus Velthaea sp.]